MIARALLAALLALVALTGCDFGLDPPTIVRTPRILAIVADPPESAPGTDITLSAMTFDPEGRSTQHRWRVCLSPLRLARASGIPVEIPDSDRCRAIEGDDTAIIDGALTAQAVEDIQALGSLGGFPAETFTGILASAGLAFEIELDLLDEEGAMLVRGYKRVALTLRMPPTTNPPPISFMVGDVQVDPSRDTPFLCVPADGTPLVVAAGTDVTLEPVVPEGGEDWLETFGIFDYSGGVRTGMENAYYSWFATGGGISEATTRPPNRDVNWATPREPGPHSVWLAVRDGHLGAGGCRVDLVVE